ncbi:outer membrane protein assembly factor BamB family protein [Lignipirellula cremea]|uniref:Outer membrane biogenesis protein BamB n=1 Tax=Lignipirellula cremea TaxID=2528010 RepID=A0A518DWS4_9BACT|nr:PQQ-binding-like beta-propeller repeat protein [Lignipirellula cremea]QDU96281.1 outer membrane biogenesis protein BamB [Lignipirellula cremea]
MIKQLRNCGLYLATWFACTAFAAWGNTPLASAQTNELRSAFPQAPRELRQAITRAQAAIDDDRYSDACAELGSLLVSAEAEDFFIGRFDESGTQSSLKAEAQNILGQMPSKGRDAYELLFGASARKLLTEAINEGSPSKLTDVTRMYFHTNAGYEGAMLLARYEWGRGRPLAAAMHLRRLLQATDSSKFEPQLSVMLAASWQAAGNPINAKRALLDLKERYPKAVVQMGGKAYPIFTDSELALTWLQEATGVENTTDVAAANQWLMHRGDASRNARSTGGMPVPSPRWRQRVTWHPTDEEQVKKLAKQYRDAGTPAIPALEPLAVNDLILMRSPKNLRAVSFATGKLLWEYPWPKPEQDDQERSVSSAGEEPVREQELNQRVFEDSPYGQVTSDGKRVFLLNEMGFATPNGFNGNPIIINRGALTRNPNHSRDTNQLVALELKTQGKLLWMVGGDTNDDEPRLENHFFLGPPLPLLGRLYVMAEVNQEIRLVVLEAATGELLWSQQLASAEPFPIQNDVRRRLAGATPSFADGVLICPTSAGAIVAVDLSTRALLWGYRYTQAQAITNRGFGPIMNTGQPQSGWIDSSVTISDGKVLVTPVESNELFCLDLLTGKEIWDAPVQRGENLYVACVHDQKVVLVGKNEMQAYDLATGKSAWTKNVSLEGMPSGRGFYADHFYVLPTTSNKLHKIDLNDAKIVETLDTEDTLGNLVCYSDEVISQAGEFLQSLPQVEPLKAEVSRRLEKNANDPWALARRGELSLAAGDTTAALEDLRRVFAQGGDDASRELLVKTLLSLVKKDYFAHRELVAELEQLLDNPQESIDLRRWQAVGLQAQGETMPAFNLLLSIAETVSRQTRQGQFQAVSQLVDDEDEVIVPLNRWIQGRLSELYSQAPAAQQQTMDRLIEERWQAARTMHSLSEMERFLEFFSFHPQAAPARLALAEQYVQTGNVLQAETSLLAWNLAQKTQVVGQPLAKSQESAAMALRLRPLDPFAEAVATAGQWRSGPVEVETERPEVPAVSAFQKVFPLSLEQIDGDLPPGVSVAFHRDSNEIAVHDGGGREWGRYPLRGETDMMTTSMELCHARFFGHLLVMSLGSDIVGINTWSASPKEAMLWRIRLAPAAAIEGSFYNSSGFQLRTTEVQSPWGESHFLLTDRTNRLAGVTGPLTARGFCYMAGSELVCADLFTGKRIWSRSGFGGSTCLFGDQEILFVENTDSNELLTVSMIDGRVIQKCTLAKDETRWASKGRVLLAWSENGAGLRLRSYNALTGVDVWSVECQHGSKGWVINQEEVAVLEPNGNFFLRRLADAQPLVSAQLEAERTDEAPLSTLQVLRSSSQYLVAVTREKPHRKGEGNVQAAPGGFHTPLVHGRLYAFSRQGERLWQTPAFISRYGMPLDQPSESPVLVFIRHYLPEDRSRPRTQLLCIDRRDGGIVYENTGIAALTSNYRLVGDASANQVSLLLPTFNIKLKFTDDPAPPAPTAQTGEAASDYVFVDKSLGGTLMRALGDGPPIAIPDPFHGNDNPFDGGALPADPFR